MRKQNSEFLTAFISEAANDIKNTDYFGCVELDNYACYVIADGIDDQIDAMSAKLAVDSVVSTFSESPSMSKRVLKRCLKTANKILLSAKSKTSLKASIIIVVTNYVKMRYGQAGNIRLRIYRDGFIKKQTTDQSLTMDMVKEDKVAEDKIAVHEERNNLYTYLGQEKNFCPYISGKIKLQNADAIFLYTRDIWEHIDEGELKDVFESASNEPHEIIDEIGDMLISRQPKDLGKYTMAVILANKIFTDPNKKRKIKKIIMILSVVLMAAITVSIVLYVKYVKKQNKTSAMEKNYTDTIEYIQMNNYVRAKECCKEAQKLAVELKNDRMQTELDNYMKLIEAVNEAQKFMDEEAYTQAQEGFKKAMIRSRYADNIGMDYIEEKLSATVDYISVYDYIYMGDTLAINLQYDKAEEKYLEAKILSAKIYFDAGRADAIEALEKLYENQKKEKEQEDELRQELLTKEESAANYLAIGDTSYAQGDYESAIVYYNSALQQYQILQEETQQTIITEKIETAKSKIEDNDNKELEAEEYMAQAYECTGNKDFITARKYYILAKDIYAALKNDDKISEIERKMEVLEIKESEEENYEENTSRDGDDNYDG